MKLADFKGEKGIAIAARIMRPIAMIVNNPKVKELHEQKGVTVLDMVGAMVENEPEQAMELFAILNEKDVEEYKANSTAANLLEDLYSMFADDDLMSLFGLRAKKTEKTPSSSATGNTKAKKK